MATSLRNRGVALGIALVVLGTGACASRNAAPTPFTGGAEESVLLVTVDNQDFRDATVYANWNGVRHRMGMVIGKTTETLSTPWRDYEVRLEVDFVGGGEMKVRDRIPVQPGEHLDFVIMPGW